MSKPIRGNLLDDGETDFAATKDNSIARMVNKILNIGDPANSLTAPEITFWEGYWKYSADLTGDDAISVQDLSKLIQGPASGNWAAAPQIGTSSDVDPWDPVISIANNVITLAYDRLLTDKAGTPGNLNANAPVVTGFTITNTDGTLKANAIDSALVGADTKEIKITLDNTTGANKVANGTYKLVLDASAADFQLKKAAGLGVKIFDLNSQFTFADAYPTIDAVVKASSLNVGNIQTSDPEFTLTLNKPMDIVITAEATGENTISTGTLQNKSNGDNVQINGLVTGKTYTFTITGTDNNSVTVTKTLSASTVFTGPQVTAITVSSNDSQAKSAVKDGDVVKVDVTFDVALGAVPTITMLLPDGADITGAGLTQDSGGTPQYIATSTDWGSAVGIILYQEGDITITITDIKDVSGRDGPDITRTIKIDNTKPVDEDASTTNVNILSTRTTGDIIYTMDVSDPASSQAGIPGSGIPATGAYTVKTGYNDYLNVNDKGEVKLSNAAGANWWRDSTAPYLPSNKFIITVKDNAGNEVEITKNVTFTQPTSTTPTIAIRNENDDADITEIAVGSSLKFKVKVTNYSGAIATNASYKLLLGGSDTGNNSGQSSGVFTVDANVDSKMGAYSIEATQEFHIAATSSTKTIAKTVPAPRAYFQHDTTTGLIYIKLNMGAGKDYQFRTSADGTTLAENNTNNLISYELIFDNTGTKVTNALGNKYDASNAAGPGSYHVNENTDNFNLGIADHASYLISSSSNGTARVGVIAGDAAEASQKTLINIAGQNGVAVYDFADNNNGWIPALKIEPVGASAPTLLNIEFIGSQAHGGGVNIYRSYDNSVSSTGQTASNANYTFYRNASFDSNLG